jgi:T5SS/PEP-CTERM-associated repeat protein
MNPQRLAMALSAVAMLLSPFIGAAFAQTFWTDGTGNWNTAGNWSLGVPNSGSATAFDAVIENGGTAQLSGPPSGSVRRMRVGRAAGAGNVLVDAATLNVTQDLYLNENGTATSSMTIRNGSTVSAPTTFIGQSSAAATNFTISGVGTTYTANNAFNVGNAGAGTATLTVDTGALLNSFGGIIGNGSGTNGVATVRNPGSTWTTTGAMTVGSSGTGTLNILDQGEVYVGTGLSINGTSTVNLNGGTLRLNTISAGLNRLVFSSGTLQLAGDRTFSSDPIIQGLYGSTVVIPTGQNLVVEGTSYLHELVRASGGGFVTHDLQIGDSSFAGTFSVFDGGKATVSGNSVMGADSIAHILGAESIWTVGGNLQVGSTSGTETDLEIDDGTLYIGGTLTLGAKATFSLDGGTLRLAGYSKDPAVVFFYYGSGTIQLAGDRNTGTDVAVHDFFGASPVIPAGKTLFVEGGLTVSATNPVTLNGGTLRTSQLVMAPGGYLNWPAGTLHLTGAGGLTIGPTGPFGSMLLLDQNDRLEVDQGLSVQSGATLFAAGGLESGAGLTNHGSLVLSNATVDGVVTNAADGTITALGNVTFNGMVTGAGGFSGPGTVIFAGSMAPGANLASVNVQGSAAFASGSTLQMELGGTTASTQYDQLRVGGNLALGGTLQVLLTGGFAPAAGQSFNLLDWGSASGTFNNLQLPALAPGLAWNASQLYTGGILSVYIVALPGDYNNNGVVDASDYVVWRKNQSTTNVLPNDPTGGTIDIAQYNTWRTHFGQTAGSGAASSLGGLGSAVPEPSSAGMALVLSLIALTVRWSPKP